MNKDTKEQALRTLFHNWGGYIFRKGETASQFEAT